MNTYTLIGLLRHTDDNIVSGILQGLSLETFQDSLQEARSLGENALKALFVDSGTMGPNEADITTRQILNEVEATLHEGTGKITIGRNLYEPRKEYYFKEGLSTGMRKVYLPCRFPSVLEGNLPRKVKVTFINLSSPQYPLITAPLGIITLGGYLKRVFGDQVEVDYVDMQLEKSGIPTSRIENFQPDIIGLSVKIGGISEMKRALSEVRALRTKTRPLIVLGNVIPTYASNEIHHTCKDVVCVIGRGENAISALAKHVANQAELKGLFRVPNASFVFGATIYEVGSLPFRLSELGMPDWEALFKKYPHFFYQEIWVEASRGCPQKKGGVGCSFCAIMPNNDSRDWVSRSTPAVTEELRILSRISVKHIRFADEEFMAGQTVQALELALELKRCREKLQADGLVMPTFDFAIRVDDVYKRGPREEEKRVAISQGQRISNNEIRKLALLTFKEAGLVQVYLGLESGSLEQLKRMYKAVKPEDNKRAIAVLREIGLQVAGGWIMIDPLMDDIKELRDNIAFLEENKLLPTSRDDDFITNPINRMRVLEGSPLVDEMRKRGLLGHKKSNLTEYDFQYKNARIAKLVEILVSWEEEIAPFMYAMKNQVAVGTFDHSLNPQLDHLSSYLFSLKRLDLEFLKGLVGILERYSTVVPQEHEIQKARALFKEKRKLIIARILVDLTQGIIEDRAGTLRDGLKQIVFSIAASVSEKPSVEIQYVLEDSAIALQ